MNSNSAKRLLQLLSTINNHVDIAITQKLSELQVFATAEKLVVQSASEFANSSIAGKAPVLLNYPLSHIVLDSDNRTLAWLLSAPLMQVGGCPVNAWTLLFLVLGASLRPRLVWRAVLPLLAVDYVLSGGHFEPYVSLALATSMGSVSKQVVW